MCPGLAQKGIDGRVRRRTMPTVRAILPERVCR
jgi:hypothetical protein